MCIHIYQFSSVQSLRCVLLFATCWTAACQASLSITNSQSLLKLMCIKSVMPCNHLTLCRALLLLSQSFPASGSFPVIQFLASGGQRIGVSASASVLPMNIQDWFPLGLTGLNSLCTHTHTHTYMYMYRASLVAQMVNHLPGMWETQVRPLGWEDPLEKEMATHSSTLTWKIPWSEEPGRLQTMGSLRVRHNRATSLSLFPFIDR